MLHSTFTKGTVQPGAGWTADCLTRYAPPVVKGTMVTYEDPKSKRSQKGRAAIPTRYLALIGASLAELGTAGPNYMGSTGTHLPMGSQLRKTM